MNQRQYRLAILHLCWLNCIFALTPHFLKAEKPQDISGEEVERSVIAKLLTEGVTKPTVIRHIDLTEPFATRTQWTFITIQDDGQPPTELEDHGPLILCLVNASVPDCDLHVYKQIRTDMPFADMPYLLFASKVEYGGPNKTRPLLFIQVCGAGATTGNGNCGIATVLYTYDRDTNRFIPVFQNFTKRNNNEATRFIESGPLQGDVIVNNPTEDAPYSYWIQVFQAGDSGQYSQILRYRSLTGYGDGNPLSVVDSEMPEILSRLRLWHPGDPLPTPTHMPKGCRNLFMRRGEEWCR